MIMMGGLQETMKLMWKRNLYAVKKKGGATTEASFIAYSAVIFRIGIILESCYYYYYYC